MIQLILIRNEAFLIDLSLNIKSKVMIGFVSIILSVVCSLVGYYYIWNNISSIFIGIFLGRLIMLLLFPYLTNKMINFQNRKQINFKLLTKIILFFISIIYIGDIQLLETWFSLLSLGSIEVILVAIILYSFILSSKNKALIYNKFIALKGRL